MRKNIVLRHLGSQEPIHTSTHSALWVRGTWYHLLVCPVASWDGWRGCYFLASSCSLSHGRWGEAEEGPPLLPPTLAGSGLQCLGLVAVARGPGLVLWDICTAVMKLLLSPLLSPLRLNPGGMRFLGYRSYPPPPRPRPGWEQICSSLCISAGCPGGMACRPASRRGLRLHGPEPQGLLPGLQKVSEAARPCRAPRPCSLAPPGSQACSFNMGGGWVECLGRIQPLESFLARDRACISGSHSRCRDRDLGRIKQRE